ncbi:hypothetical protein D0Y65_009410 [Glycine soja]|uniref:Myb-like domain-containing protein n=1 Tax=Glycine soja TaxID=3848 RepID=A0A445KZD8_GLYSO|nr:hypothetical protein D0Y65_009410 [Glycine soja]
MYRPPHSSENFQNPPQYVMCPPPPPTSENSQNPPQYIMYPPPPHMWYMHPSSNVEPPTNGSSQNPQIYSQPSTPTNSNTCYRSSLSNIVLPSNEIESPIGVDGVDQTSKQYWARIKNAYNNDDVHQSGQFCERSWTQLKSQWSRIHPPVQKFNECYKQANKHRRSGSSEKDVLVDAHMIYSQDTGIYTIFGNEYLRRPNDEDTERLLQMGVARRFPVVAWPKLEAETHLPAFTFKHIVLMPHNSDHINQYRTKQML